jgi:hypothetical protein
MAADRAPDQAAKELVGIVVHPNAEIAMRAIVRESRDADGLILGRAVVP